MDAANLLLEGRQPEAKRLSGKAFWVCSADLVSNMICCQRVRFVVVLGSLQLLQLAAGSHGAMVHSAEHCICIAILFSAGPIQRLPIRQGKHEHEPAVQKRVML